MSLNLAHMPAPFQAPRRNCNDDFDRYFAEFFHSYVTAALWSSNDGSTDCGGEPLDENYGVGDIEEETLIQMAEECFEFLATAETVHNRKLTCFHVIKRAYHLDAFEPGLSGDNNAWSQAGYDFWMTRNGHGVGFWEDEWTSALDPFRRLERAARKFGEFDLMVNDLELPLEDRTVYGFPLK